MSIFDSFKKTAIGIITGDMDDMSESIQFQDLFEASDGEALLKALKVLATEYKEKQQTVIAGVDASNVEKIKGTFCYLFVNLQ